MKIYLKNRDFSEKLELPSVVLEVDTLSWMAVGGPDTAVIRASGPEAALWELVELLKCPVQVCDHRGELVWWGYVDSVKVSQARVSLAADLASMANKVAVTYSMLESSPSLAGGRVDTPWAQNLDSQSEYGVKELKFPIEGSTLAQAVSLRDKILEQRKYPVALPQISSSPQGEGPINHRSANTQGATLTCKGWWHILDWSYYASNAGYAGHELASAGVQFMGNILANTHVAQSFVAAGTFAVIQAAVKVRKVGAPADNFTIGIAANAAGVPGGALATAVIPGAQISPDSYEWLSLPIAGLSLVSGTTYWIYTARSGGFDGGNYYALKVDETLAYSGGVLKIHNGAAWVNRAPDADLNFVLTGVSETTSQIRNILTAVPGFSALDLDINSGVGVSPWRSGKFRTRTEVEELLLTGTISGRRMLATVTPQLRLQISLEPAPAAADQTLSQDGTLRDRFDNPIPPQTPPVGTWARLRDVIPTTADLSRLADPSRVFIEAAEYHHKTRSTTFTTRLFQPSIYDLNR